MQGQEASQQVTTSQSNAGIDVSKDWLDIHVLPQGRTLRVSNDPQGIGKLKRWLVPFDAVLIAVEATGKWHRPLCRSLHASGLPVAVVDPFRVRMFAKAQGILAKTDRLDARVLASFAAVMTPPARPPAPEAMEILKELVTARDSLAAQQAGLKNQLGAAHCAFLKRQLKARLARGEKDIAALEREILNRIEADEALARRHAILLSVPGFGPAVAASLVANLAELGACTAKQIGLLAGLAPIADESGKRQGVRVIWGGRAGARRMLYLAALSAARFNADMKAFYRRLIDDQKPAKLALVAVARKLVILANTLVSQDRIWQQHAPKPA
jgi:transposase